MTAIAAVPIVGLIAMLLGATLWLAADRARFLRRSPFGMLPFQSYAGAWAFTYGTNAMTRAGRLLMKGGAVLLFFGIIAASQP